MTANPSDKPLDKYLKQLHGYAQTFEVAVRQMIEDTTDVGREAEAANADFTTFVASWAAMLPEVCDLALADEAGIDLAAFAASLEDLLVTIAARIAANEALREAMKRSISNNIANAQLISQNFQWLEEVTPVLFADRVSMMRSEEIVVAAIEEVKRRGEPATLRLKWLKAALKDV